MGVTEGDAPTERVAVGEGVPVREEVGVAVFVGDGVIVVEVVGELVGEAP